MSIASSMRSLIPLVTGLAVGGVGAWLFMQSMPGAAGSPEERANKLEVALKRAQNRLAALEVGAAPRRHVGRSTADGVRDIAEDIREGRPVSPDDIFRASQPLLRDLAPLLDRMRVKQAQQMAERMTGEWARKYDLTAPQRQALTQWFEQKSQEDAQRWNQLIAQDGTRLEDIMRASRDVRPDDGLDSFMENTLKGDKLTAFKTERMNERAQRVQQHADSQVARLDAMVTLDDAQRDQMFGIMARSSRDYDPAMKLEGVGGDIAPSPNSKREDAVLAVLRQDQRSAYLAEQQRRRDEAAKSMEAMGLTLPPTWNALDGNDFN